jgi:Phage integrase, N-terminal SAM-like domain
MFLMVDSDLQVDDSGAGWALSGPAAPRFALVNDFLGYLADRRYSPKTVRAYAFDLLAFCRWLLGEDAQLADVTAEMLLRYLAYCRAATFRGRPGGNVYSIRDGRSTGYAAATVNRRMAAISGMFEFRAMRDLDTPSPVPKGAARRQAGRGARSGLLGPLAHRGRRRSCGSGSPAGCRRGWTPARPRPCWAASAAGGIRRSPG